MFKRRVSGDATRAPGHTTGSILTTSNKLHSGSTPGSHVTRLRITKPIGSLSDGQRCRRRPARAEDFRKLPRADFG